MRLLRRVLQQSVLLGTHSPVERPSGAHPPAHVARLPADRPPAEQPLAAHSPAERPPAMNFEQLVVARKASQTTFEDNEYVTELRIHILK